MGIGQTMNWTDGSVNAWDLIFLLSGTHSGGWILIIDNQGNVVDFIAWDWAANDIAGMSVTVNGFTVTSITSWVGNGLSGSGMPSGNSF